MEDHALVTIVQERPSGERVMQDAHRVFPIGSGRPTRMAGAARARAAIRTRQPGADRRHPLLFRCSWQEDRRGGGRDAARPSLLLLGTGYGLETDWRHGMYQGELVVQGQEIAPADPSYSNWGLTEYAAKFTSDGQVGYGMFECAVMGPHRQYGFEGWE